MKKKISVGKWSGHGVKHIGCQRNLNEDNFFLSSDLRVAAVVDGWGTSTDGVLLSELAISSIASRWETDFDIVFGDSECVSNWILATMNQIHQIILDHKKSESIAGVAIVLIARSEENRIEVGSVGNARAYLVSGKQCTWLTPDDLGFDQLSIDGITADQKEWLLKYISNPYKSWIPNLLGVKDDFRYDVTSVRLTSGDRVVLISDGVDNTMGDDEIFELSLSQTNLPISDLCENLLLEVLEKESPDNISIVGLEFESSFSE